MNFRVGGFNVPEVIKNIMIINLLFFIASVFTLVNSNGATDLNSILGLYNPESPHFRPFQIVTHMFMHDNMGISHLFFNMLTLWMFGSEIENYWGGKRFLIFYVVTGIGAGLMFALFNSIQAHYFFGPDLINNYGLSTRELSEMVKSGSRGGEFIQPVRSYLGSFNSPMVGASGAVYGVLLAYGMMFAEREVNIYFLFPVKAKYVVAVFGALELSRAIQNDPNNNIAHVAHLSGILFGYLIIKTWQRKNNS